MNPGGSEKKGKEKGSEIRRFLSMKESKFPRIILLYMFLTGLCSFGYELVMERTMVIILGSSSAAMGLIISTFILGYLSSFYFGKWVDKNQEPIKIVSKLLMLECLICVLLVIIVPCLRYAPFIADYLSYLIFFYYLDYYYVLLLTLGLFSLVVPVIMGAEIPFAIKLLANSTKGSIGKNDDDNKEQDEVYSVIGQISGWVFAFDSIGAALGGFLTALVLIPLIGRLYSSVVLALTTLLAGVILLVSFNKQHPAPSNDEKGNKKKNCKRKRTMKHRKKMVFYPVLALIIVFVVAINMKNIEQGPLSDMYGGNILFQTDTSYQEIVITEIPVAGTALYLDGQMQISELDDEMYHEFLVHPALISHDSPKSILIIGGGDGGTLEEILKHDIVEEITLIELDREVIDISQKYLQSINNGSFDHPKVKVLTTDGRVFAREYSGDGFDVVIGDLPDPDSEAVAMLYTCEFFSDIQGLLKPNGIFALQSASWYEYPMVTASIIKTLDAEFTNISLYLANVWTFGPWSFSIGSEKSKWNEITIAEIENRLTNRTIETVYYNGYTHKGSFLLADNPFMDEAMKKARISTLDRPILQNPWM